MCTATPSCDRIECKINTRFDNDSYIVWFTPCVNLTHVSYSENVDANGSMILTETVCSHNNSGGNVHICDETSNCSTAVMMKIAVNPGDEGDITIHFHIAGMYFIYIL